MDWGAYVRGRGKGRRLKQYDLTEVERKIRQYAIKEGCKLSLAFRRENIFGD